MSHIKPFRDPDMSLWQSAVDEVVAMHTAKAQVQSVGETPVIERPASDNNMVQGAIIDGEAEQQNQTLQPPSAGGTTATEGVGGFAQYCSSMARQLALAKIKGDAAEVAACEAQFAAYQQCDPRWLEVAEKYAEFEAAAKISDAKVPYIVYDSIDDFVIDGKLSDNAKVAIVADWGTGQDVAKQVLAQIARKSPDVVIHLGDIYYSCTDFEVQNYFLQIWKQYFDPSKIPSFTLSGNHDMYSGGAPYYSLLKTLNQPASYCCLRNQNWQFVMMDTGLNDRTPGGVDPTFLTDTEVAWVTQRVATAAGRKTIFLSHHQLFTRFSNIVDPPPAGQNGLSVNPRLQTQVGGLLPQVAVWLWGHEHDMVIYEKQLGVLARCLGNGAIPVLPPSDPPGSPPPHLEITADETIRPVLNGEFFTHGYAIIQLTGPNATISYYMDNDETTPVKVDNF
jgi:Calcineurin-like phosphoesterase